MELLFLLNVFYIFNRHKKLYNETLEKLHQLKVNGEDTSNVQDELTKLKMEAEEIKRQEEELKHKDKVMLIIKYYLYL